MRMEVFLEGTAVVKADVDLPKIATLFASALRAFGTVPKSTPMAPGQATELLDRVHPKSATFLRRLAANNGSITWPEMQAIFGYHGTNWPDFSSSHNRGINTSMGSITGQPGCKLVHWDDDEAGWGEEGWTTARVYVDGEALRSLRIACGLETV